MCVACATPVRGRLIGVECLSAVMREVTPPAAPSPFPRRGDAVAAVGFIAVLGLSIFPWSRGAFSGLFAAWSANWSLLAVAGAAAGIAAAVLAIRTNRRPGLAGVAYAALGLVIGIAAVLHRIHPPVLSEPSLPSALALVGAGVVLAGAGIKIRDVMRARRPHR